MNPIAANDAKEQVRQATDIVDLVGGYLQLRRQGRNYVGLCPWHDDSKPSLQVNPERQTFKCWVCDIGGDVFSFLMRIDGLEFREALEALAERAGIPLIQHRGPKPEAGSPGDKKTLLAAAAWAEERFHECLLRDPLGEPARQYFAEREISAESVARFRLGFAPDRWDWLLNQARSGGFSGEVLERIGLVRPRQQGGGWYDFYRGRVMFPIRDVRSRPIAFGGRVLPAHLRSDPGDENVGGKYINSPETPLFSKSNQLYALDLARDAIASEGRIVVTEGYTDVIMAHQHGVQNVVAVLGTALGEKHLPVLRRFTDSIVLVLDGDEAGQRRANEVLELFVANQIDLRILGLPNGLDPCDFIAKPKEGQGPQAFAELVRQAPDALEHMMQTVTNGLVTTDTHGATRAAERLLATLSKVKAGVGEASSAVLLREQNLLGRMSRRLQLPEDGLRRRLVELRRRHNQPARVDDYQSPPTPEADALEAPTPAPVWRLSQLPPREAELLELLVSGLTSAAGVFSEVSIDDLASDAARHVYQLCRGVLERDGQVDLHRLLDAAGNEATKSLLVEIDEASAAKAGGSIEQRAADLVDVFRRRRDDAHRRGQLAALREGRLDDQQQQEQLSDIFAKLKNRQAGPLSTDG